MKIFEVIRETPIKWFVRSVETAINNAERRSIMIMYPPFLTKILVCGEEIEIAVEPLGYRKEPRIDL